MDIENINKNDVIVFWGGTLRSVKIIVKRD
jgi:hypothetical protein